MRQARHLAARGGPVRRRAPVHAPRSGGRRPRRGDRQQGDRRRRIAGSGLARRAGRIRAISARASRPASRCTARSSSARARRPDDEDAFERKLFLARKVISNAVYNMKDARTAGYYPVSLSSRTIVYKGMVLVHQLGRLLPRPAGPALRERDRARPSALRHQHLPDMAARASLSHGRP